MFSLFEINVFKAEIGLQVQFGPEVNAIAFVGGKGETPAPPAELSIPPPLTPQDHPDPFALLNWRTRLSEFAGREPQMAELRQWAEDPRLVSVKLITGEGGVGKTRLAAEFGETLQCDNWSSGFVYLRKSQSFPCRKNGTLMIVDYPEENRPGLDEFLRDLSEINPKSKFRVLLLTRKTADYWQDLMQDTRASVFVDMNPIHLEQVDAVAA